MTFVAISVFLYGAKSGDTRVLEESL